MLATCNHSHRGLRDKALLMPGWASGGRRRSEIAALSFDDVDMREFDSVGLLRIRLLATKTRGPELAPRLPLKGRPAWAVMAWITVAPARTGRGSAPSARPTAC